MLESDADLLCGACGYNLRGVDSGRCPECGVAFDRNHLVANLIPWEQKRQIGRILAYFRTADAVTRGPRNVAAKVNHPVSLKAAKRFTTITVIVVFLSLLPVVATMLQGFAYDPDARNLGMYKPQTTKEMLRVFGDDEVFASMTFVGLLCFVIVAPAVPRIFFRRRRLDAIQRQRAEAIGHYAIAPLAWIPGLLLGGFVILTIFELIALDRHERGFFSGFNAGPYWMILFPLLAFVFAWVSAVKMVQPATKCSQGRVMATAIGVPLLWTLSLIACVVIPHAVATLGLLFLRPR